MSIALSTILRALAALLACAGYMKYHGSPGASVNQINASTTGLHKQHYFDSYGTDTVNVFNFVQVYVAFEVLCLYIWPFWRLYSQRTGPVRFVWDWITHWVAAFIIFVGVLALKEHLVSINPRDIALWGTWGDVQEKIGG